MKPILRKNQQGVAMIIAVMILSLGGSIALIAFRSSTQELGLSRFTEYEMNSQYLVESGIDQVLSWVVEPSSFPATYTSGVGFDAVRTFFAALPTSPCEDDSDDPDLVISEASFLSDPQGPFSELKTMGEITKIALYAPIQPETPDPDDTRLCTLEVTAISGGEAKKKIKVDLAGSSIGPITAGIQGLVTSTDMLPLWTHWGGIHYAAFESDGVILDANLGLDIFRVPILDPSAFFDANTYSDLPSDYDSNIDRELVILVETDIGPLAPDNGNTFINRPNVLQQQNEAASLDEANLDDPNQRALRRFLRANAELYAVTDDGRLERNGVIKTFDETFGILDDDISPDFRLAWISLNPDSSTAPLEISGGRYKGYFFFSGDRGINILGGRPGREIVATTPAEDPITLEEINLEGLFYTNGPMAIQDNFTGYGAFFSRGGFTGPGTQDLEVWYNASFANAIFPGIRSVAPLAGTWATLSSDDY